MALFATLLVSPLALGETLELPADAEIEVQVIDRLVLDEAESRRDDILLKPVANGGGSHQLPDYCVMIGDAQRNDERLRLTASSITCIETEGSDSDIFSGEISAAAFGADGNFGLAACDSGRCELGPEQGFTLRLAEALAIEEQHNPSAQINEQRRQADGEGVANPIPAEQPDPEQ
ncbi:hypothetical protein C1H70_12880 [Halomonas urumqiensis]|uniref:Uncharacterized protein n=1 Tax=Halomonas urumqiensis TaxID=1684789 RepID=A0A2N7UFT9_9GAMM|nr:hypothetical protein C1H70_12880 [Halomonas urumqiensis]PTB04335.1 hypothetical protein C6V82_05165 [Halomonas urumqiensis]